MNEIGKKLQDARILKNWSVEMLHERTKIAVHIIEMIESGERGQLPDTIYRGFVKTLCDELEIDSKSVLGIPRIEKPSSQGEDTDDEKSGFSFSGLGAWFGQNQRYWLLVFFALVVIAIVFLYIKYGKKLFSEPAYEPLVRVEIPADSLTALRLPFELTLVPTKEIPTEIDIDSSGSMFKTIKSGETITLKAEEFINIGVDDPTAVLLLIGSDSLVWQAADSGFGTDLMIDALGVQSAKARLQRIEEPVKVTPPPPPKEEPQMWIGHITEPTLYLDFPGYLDAKRNYSPNPDIIRQIQERNPSYSVIAFFRTSDPESQRFIGQMLKVLESVRSDGLSLTLIGVGKRNRDKAGLTDFYQVTQSPVIVFLFKGQEVGRMTPATSLSPEQWLLNLTQTSKATG